MSSAVEERLLARVSGARRALHALPVAAASLDLAIVAATVYLAARVRRTGFLLDPQGNIPDLTVLGLLLTAAWFGLLALNDAYERDVFGAGIDEYKRVANASGMTAGLLGISCYLAKVELSRGFFVFVFAIGVPALLLGRFLLRRGLHRARRQGHFRQRVLLVGTTDTTNDIARVLLREPWLGYEVIGALTRATDLDVETASGVPVLGNVDEATELAPRLGADLVFFAGGGITSSAQMRKTLWDLEHANVHVVVAPNMTDMASERVKIRPVGGLPLIHVGKPRAAEALNRAKRVFDVAGALAALLLFSPLLAVAAIQVRRFDGGPVLFRQERIGRDGEPFHCLKFRTMVVDAEDRLAELHRLQGHTEGLFKMVDDPRITKPGKWLRRYSVDELPQLWNVVRGEMSLVGPRPPLAREVAAYDMVASRRLRVRPGMTGLWQVSGRSNLSWDEAVRLDIYYVDNWSMVQDLTILARTLRAVVGSEGAY